MCFHANTPQIIFTQKKEQWQPYAQYFLGDVRSTAAKLESAQQTYRADLKDHLNNCWDLYGGYQALQPLKRDAKAPTILMAFHKAGFHSDTEITTLAF